MASSVTEQVIRHLWHSAERRGDQFLGAVVDAARDPDIHRAIHASDSDSWCLMSGDVSLNVAEVSPYLVLFEKGASLLDTLVSKGWNDSWCVFFSARPHFEALLERLQSNVTARLPSGENVFFRYYDPRVLRVYLPTCNAGELELFFGVVTSWIAPDADGRIVEYRRSRRAALLLRPWGDPGGARRAAGTAAALDFGMPHATAVYPSGLLRKSCAVVAP